MVLYAGAANASSYVFTAYDPNFYSESGIVSGTTYALGTPTAISDIYYYYDIKNQTMQTTQTDWLSTGLYPIGTPGAEQPAGYDTILNYSGITFDNMQSVMGIFMPDFVYNDLKSQLGGLLSQSVDSTGAISKHTRNWYYANINQIENRLYSRTDKDRNIWAAQLYNYQRQNESRGFSGNTMGISVGADNYISDNLLLGFGYTFDDTDITAGANTINSTSHNIYFYSKYKFDQQYINGILNYGFANYRQKNTTDFGAINGAHRVENYGAAILTGYEMPNNIRPEIGLRYIYISQDAYIDSIGGRIKQGNNEALTLVTGVKYNYDIKPISLRPKINFLYDVISNGDVINTNIYGYKQRIVADNFSPFGIESGLAVETLFDNFNVSLEYDFSIRSNYQSHTAMLRARYSF